MWPTFLSQGGLMIWVILCTSAVAIVVFIERVLHYHRAQINSMEFLNGVRNVLKRANVVEAISICDATPGPVARLVKVAILNRDKGRDGVREALEEAGLAPLMGLFGTVLGFIKIFTALQTKTTIPTMQDLSGGVWQALICTAAGLAVSIPCYAAYNYLVSRVNAIVLDMEKAATEIANILADV
jgi:biopolymer transport protein ExbB